VAETGKGTDADTGIKGIGGTEDSVSGIGTCAVICAGKGTGIGSATGTGTGAGA